jgi:hypothetical protein
MSGNILMFSLSMKTGIHKKQQRRYACVLLATLNLGTSTARYIWMAQMQCQGNLDHARQMQSDSLCPRRLAAGLACCPSHGLEEFDSHWHTADSWVQIFMNDMMNLKECRSCMVLGKTDGKITVC